MQTDVSKKQTNAEIGVPNQRYHNALPNATPRGNSGRTSDKPLTYRGGVLGEIAAGYGDLRGGAVREVVTIGTAPGHRYRATNLYRKRHGSKQTTKTAPKLVRP